MENKEEIIAEKERLLKLMGKYGANGYDEGIIYGLNWVLEVKDE